MNSSKAPILLKGGFKALGTLIQKESARFAAAPILLIEGGGRHDHHIDGQQNSGAPLTRVGRQMHLLLAHKLGLPTTTVSTQDALFPTYELLQHQVELATRLGATTICGVGNRPAMDLAKAVARAASGKRKDSPDNNKELLLVPASYDAVLACSHPHCLFLHEKEDVVVLGDSEYPTLLRPMSKTPTVACLDADAFETKGLEANTEMAIQTCMSILLHCAKYNQRGDPELFQDAGVLLADCLNLAESLEQAAVATNIDLGLHQLLVEKLLQVGHKFLEFGLRRRRTASSSSMPVETTTRYRSIPLAVAVSLLPTVFPDRNLLEVMAAMFRALTLQMNPKDSGVEVHNLKHALDGQPLTTTQPMATLERLVRQSQAHWDCVDAPMVDLRFLLDHVVALTPEDEAAEWKAAQGGGVGAKPENQHPR